MLDASLGVSHILRQRAGDFGDTPCDHNVLDGEQVGRQPERVGRACVGQHAQGDRQEFMKDSGRVLCSSGCECRAEVSGHKVESALARRGSATDQMVRKVAGPW